MLFRTFFGPPATLPRQITMRHSNLIASPQHLPKEMPRTNWLLFVLLSLLSLPVASIYISSIVAQSSASYHGLRDLVQCLQFISVVCVVGNASVSSYNLHEHSEKIAHALYARRLQFIRFICHRLHYTNVWWRSCRHIGLAYAVVARPQHATVGTRRS